MTKQELNDFSIQYDDFCLECDRILETLSQYADRCKEIFDKAAHYIPYDEDHVLCLMDNGEERYLERTLLYKSDEELKEYGQRLQKFEKERAAFDLATMARTEEQERKIYELLKQKFDNK